MGVFEHCLFEAVFGNSAQKERLREELWNRSWLEGCTPGFWAGQQIFWNKKKIILETRGQTQQQRPWRRRGQWQHDDTTTPTAAIKLAWKRSASELSRDKLYQTISCDAICHPCLCHFSPRLCQLCCQWLQRSTLETPSDLAKKTLSLRPCNLPKGLCHNRLIFYGDMKELNPVLWFCWIKHRHTCFDRRSKSSWVEE